MDVVSGMNTNLEIDEIETQIKAISQRVREEREKARISQMELSLKAGLSQNQVFCIETGKRIPNLYTLLRVCEALKINPAALFTPPEEEKTKAKTRVIELINRYM
ncbi:MAG: helix-turn-helix domain-containing protein [Treponema sp.]|jgi:transcriptional regulator with XRE-family HTH domain|nr:helix-turn-helix domain-containing protein [Treponema sp.]